MKKLIAITLVLAALVLTLASCGAINKNEVAVLWSDLSDDYLFTISDALDRAMYIDNIKYKHYDAKNDGAEQLNQAKAAIAAGAPALIVNPTDVLTATAILGEAKGAGIPLVFLCSSFAADIAQLASGYDKCITVNTDASNLYKTLGEKIAEDLLEKYDDYDRNNDGKITYTAFGLSSSAVPFINEKLTAAGKKELDGSVWTSVLPTTNVGATINQIFGDYDGSGNEVNATPTELILTDDDAYVEEILVALRAYELNYEKLVTHFIPLYTVGVAANAADLIDSTNEDERAAYSVMSAIDDGFLSGAALEDDDAIALAAAHIVRNSIKGKPLFDKINEAYIKDGDIIVPYTFYGN